MKKTIISILLLACLALGLCSCAGGEKMKNGIKEFGDGAKDALDDIFAAEAPLEVALCAAAATVVETEEGSVLSQTVQALVVADADVDISIDWTVSWGVNPYGEEVPVTDYVTVVPESDGALVADIICHQAIDRTATAIVTATVRGKDKSASCTVRYNGIPSDIVFTGEDGTALENALSVDGGTSTAIALTLDNLFHDVGTDYSNIQVEFTVSGIVRLVLDENGAAVASLDETEASSASTEITTFQMADLYETNGGSVTLEDGILTIAVPGTGYYTTPDGYMATFSSAKAVMVLIAVTEQVSGLSESFLLTVDYTTVSVSDSEVTF